MDIRALRNIAVVSISNGEKVGVVDDILLDTNQRRIQSFVIGSGGLFGGKTGIVDMADVRSIGTDAIMIEDRSVIHGSRDEDRYRAFPDVRAVTSLRVVTASGEFVGNLDTLQVEPASGAIAALEVAKGGLLGAFRSNNIIPVEQVISIGRDVAVVPDQYSEAGTTVTAETEPGSEPPTGASGTPTPHSA